MLLVHFAVTMTHTGKTFHKNFSTVQASFDKSNGIMMMSNLICPFSASSKEKIYFCVFEKTGLSSYLTQMLYNEILISKFYYLDT